MSTSPTREEIIELLTPTGHPTKTFTQLPADGIPHPGGLAQLAARKQETWERKRLADAAAANSNAVSLTRSVVGLVDGHRQAGDA